MNVDRRTLLTGAVAAAAAAPVRAQTHAPSAGSEHLAWPEPTETIDLWPNLPARTGAPALVETVRERSRDPSYNDRYVLGIGRPRMAVFRPAVPKGGAALIMPGGSYRWVVVDKEGYEMARWLNGRGITAFVLFYRLPHEGWASGPDTPIVDAQRAMRLVRHRAAAYRLDAHRVCALGFSAGGHACASLLTRFDAKLYQPVDDADSLSARPDIAAPIYPVISMSAPTAHGVSRGNLIGESATAGLERAYNPALHIPRNAPPTFLCHAEDDPSVPVENTLMLRERLLKAKVSVETHLYPNGGHGFGLRLAKGRSVDGWEEVFFAWGHKQGVF